MRRGVRGGGVRAPPPRGRVRALRARRRRRRHAAPCGGGGYRLRGDAARAVRGAGALRDRAAVVFAVVGAGVLGVAGRRGRAGDRRDPGRGDDRGGRGGRGGRRVQDRRSAPAARCWRRGWGRRRW